MKIYNTLTRKKEEFTPLVQGKAGMYVCGPTVYSNIHIGNARPIVVFDTVRRYLRYKGYEVRFVSNFTDIDDKIIRRANEEGVAFNVISERYIADALEVSDNLNCLRADVYPRVTEEIGGIIDMIGKLIEKGNAYEKNGAVFFETATMPNYGRLSGKKIKELEAGARVEVDLEKRSPSDFALWKPAKPGEPSWASPWGNGRPGWHIECSVMSKKYLGDTLDIHAGGDDLVFPHHENELAQSSAANGTEFVKYWMHNGMINVDNRKMSKSEGNFFLLTDITKDYSYDVLRFFYLSAHYRMPLNFSGELLAAAESSLMRIRNSYADIKFITENAEQFALLPEESKIIEALPQFRARFEEAMEDDFNTANAITAIFELVKFANINVGKSASKPLADAVLLLIDELCGILGVKTEAADMSAEAGILALIEKRQAARKEKNFAEADRIRNELAEMGITLKDTPAGVQLMRTGKQ